MNKRISILFAVCISLPAFAADIVQRDPTVDCEGVPRWDRFVVNSKDTKWDPADGGCYMLYANKQVAPADAKRMYGQYDENAGFESQRAMYGKFDGSYKSSVEKPAVIAAPVAVRSSSETIAASVKPAVVKPAAKPADKKPAQVVAAPVPVKKSAPSPAVEPKPVPVAAPAKKTSSKPAPKPAAANIANAVGGSPDDYCTAINSPVMGKLPAGLVLMSGAPDKMCCVAK